MQKLFFYFFFINKRLKEYQKKTSFSYNKTLRFVNSDELLTISRVFSQKRLKRSRFNFCKEILNKEGDNYLS